MRITPLTPVASKLTETTAQTRWQVDHVRGKSYIVTTYPGASKHVFIERADDRKASSGHRIRTEVIAAVRAAGGIQ